MLDPLLAVHASLAKRLKTLGRRREAFRIVDGGLNASAVIVPTPGMAILRGTSASSRAAVIAVAEMVGPYLGLTPRQYQSGEGEWIGDIGKSNDSLLRSYLYEAAGVLMTRLRRSCPLQEMGIADRQAHWKRASFAVARKLAVVLHAISRSGTAFEWPTIDAHPA